MATTNNETSPAPSEKRRRRGDSSIRQQNEKSWIGQVSFPKAADGTRVRKSVTGPTREIVALKVKELEAMRTRGIAPTVKDPTVEMLATRWLEEIVEPTLKPMTYRIYEQMVRLYIVPGLGRLRLSRTDVDTIDRFLRQKLKGGPKGEKPLAPQTVRNMKNILHRMWFYALKWKWATGSNIVDSVDSIAVRKQNTVTLTGEELGEFTSAFRGHRYEAIFTIAIGLGLRFGELLALRWVDIDLQSRFPTLDVVHQLQRIEGKLKLMPPKSDSSHRTINLPNFVIDVITVRREAQNRERLLYGPEWKNELGLVSTNLAGSPLDPSAVRKEFRILMKKCETENLRIHDLRHIAASIMLGSHVTLVDTAGILGHADPSVTGRVYSHVMQDGKRKAAQAMDKAFNSRRDTEIK